MIHVYSQNGKYFAIKQHYSYPSYVFWTWHVHGCVDLHSIQKIHSEGRNGVVVPFHGTHGNYRIVPEMDLELTIICDCECEM